MRTVQALMMLLGALAVLMTGVAPASALADHSSSPPCHQAATHHGAGTPTPDPGEAMKAMDCCVSCVAAPGLRPPERARVTSPRPAAAAPPVAMPRGELPSPEPHPPRPNYL